jgi:hypothetical protein
MSETRVLYAVGWTASLVAGMLDVERKIGSGCPHYWARGRTDALLTLHTLTAARLGAFDRATVYICNLHCMIQCCAYAPINLSTFAYYWPTAPVIDIYPRLGSRGPRSKGIRKTVKRTCASGSRVMSHRLHHFRMSINFEIPRLISTHDSVRAWLTTCMTDVRTCSIRRLMTIIKNRGIESINKWSGVIILTLR